MAKKRSKKKDTVKINWRAVGKLSASCFAVAIITTGAYLGSMECYRYLTTTPYFHIDKLNVKGHRMVGEATIMKTIGPVLGRNTFTLDIPAIGERLKANPWIKTVEVKRTLPSTLEIKVIERVPVAIAVISGTWLMDKEGVLLDKANPASDLILPKLKNIKADVNNIKAGISLGRSAVKPALDAIARLEGYRLFGSKPLDSVSLNEPDRLKISFKGSDTRLIAPQRKWTDELERLFVVDYLLRKRNENIKSIDITFNNKVIVTQPQAYIGVTKGEGSHG